MFRQKSKREKRLNAVEKKATQRDSNPGLLLTDDFFLIVQVRVPRHVHHRDDREDDGAWRLLRQAHVPEGSVELAGFCRRYNRVRMLHISPLIFLSFQLQLLVFSHPLSNAGFA